MIIEFLSLWIFLVLATSAVAVGIGLCADKIVKLGDKLKEVRFVDNGDGTVLDTKTGLVWLKRTIGEYSWDEANEATIRMTDINGVYAGWRLPTVEELTGMIDYARWGMALPPDLYKLCNMQSAIYWTGTTYANSPNEAWFVSLTSGLVGYTYKSHEYFVWPVKGGRNGKR